MTRIILAVLLLLLTASVSAQMKVTGRVIDLQNKPVSDVIVKLVSGTKTLAFTSSNAQGVYSLEVKNAPSGEVTLQFNHISYEKKNLPLLPPTGGGGDAGKLRGGSLPSWGRLEGAVGEKASCRMWC